MKMNLDEVQSTWNSPRNNLPTAEQQRLAGQFTRQMIRRRRFQTIWLVHTFFALTIITVLAVRAIALGKADPGEEWGLFPLLMVPWLFAFHFLRRHLKPVSPVSRGESSIMDSVRAALDSNRSERSRLKVVAALFAIMIPLLAVSMNQLLASGKVSSRELTSMAVFFGGTLLLSAAGIVVRIFGRVLPQQRQLDAVLAELTDEAR